MPIYLVTASSLNLRSTPRMADNIIGSLERGAQVERLGASDDMLWLKVRRATKVGWAFSKYLTKEGDAPTPVVETEEFPWMPIALSELGVKEVRGNGNNPRIVEYLLSTDLRRADASMDSTAWCSGFVNWCVEKAGFAGSNSAWARSWLNWGRSLSRPRRGCVAVFSRKGGGHVAFYIGKSAGQYVVLGGNQADQVCVAGYPEARLLGFRVPA